MTIPWRRALLGLTGSLVLLAGGAWLSLPRWNDYKVDGELRLGGLDAPLRIVRDDHGMAYVHGGSLEDVVFGQGFVTAQDRFFNMHLLRLVAQGRVSELAGEAGVATDTLHRTLGLYNLAKAHAPRLDSETRLLMDRYVAGVNAFLTSTPDDLHLEFRPAGLEPEPWTVEDSLSLMYLMSWSNAANLKHELVDVGLLSELGLDRAQTLRPLNINPDIRPALNPEPDLDADGPAPEALSLARSSRHLGGVDPRHLLLPTLDFNVDSPLRVGSNNWAIAPERSASGAAMVAGDPHLDARLLPGVWYPSGLIWPQGRAVGASIPGLPGLGVGRTDHVALSMTNAYGDVQDLYVETLDPESSDRYLEGDVSIAFERRLETLKIKDKNASGGFREQTFEVRSSRRGPVVSRVFDSLQGTPQVITLRWAAAHPDLRSERLAFLDVLHARNVDEANQSLDHLTLTGLNFVMADRDGQIAWRVSGRLPRRLPGTGATPLPVTSPRDNWLGWIPPDEMPWRKNPPRGWLGTANHYTVGPDFPFYYTNFVSPSYRYARLTELMAEKKDVPITVDDAWRWQRDILNPMARELAPIFVDALKTDPDGRPLAEILADWDARDRKDTAAPLVFQEVYRRLVIATFADEMGPAAETFFADTYYWQERLQRMILDNDAVAESWFDDRRTPEPETLSELIVQAGRDAAQALGESSGGNLHDLRWGDRHYLRLVHPLRREGRGADWLGSGRLPMDGSGETLYRALPEFHRPYAAKATASLRMVVDFGDDDKIRAVLPGGVAGRMFHPHQQDQVDAFMSGETLYWWFSDAAIRQHARHELRLVPAG